MSVQQIIAQLDNELANATVTASAVLPSSAIRSLGMTRQGTGLVTLAGPYTGDIEADYDIEIVSASGTGRASTPSFSGVGSGSLTVTEANIPAQEVSITLITPPFAGAYAECMVGADVLRSALTGDDGNRIKINVSASGLVISPSGGAALEDIASGQDELTGYLWDIPEIIAATDLSGNVPADAPRVRFGSDPQVYRIVRDYRGGAAKIILSPAAVRAIPKGSVINLVTGTYTVVVTGEGLGPLGADIVEPYPSITTGYDLLLALISSSLLRPAYTPSPVTTPGGNARVDLPVLTCSYPLIESATLAAIRPDDLSSRAAAGAETVTLACKGNGSWLVTGTASGALPDARDGERYAPIESPVLLTIPERPAPLGSGKEPVEITSISLVSRGTGVALPNICIEGVLGKNASPKTISAIYTARPVADDCLCDTVVNPRFSASCLGISSINFEGGDSEMDAEYQSRLIALYAWQRDYLEGQLRVAAEGGSLVVIEMQYSLDIYGGGYHSWQRTLTSYATEADAIAARGSGNWVGCITPTGNETAWGTELADAFPSAAGGAYAGINQTVPASTTEQTDSADIEICHELTSLLAGCLAQVYPSPSGCAAWDAMFTDVQNDMHPSAESGVIPFTAVSFLYQYSAAADYVLTCAGIVPGKTNPAGGSVTGCWQDDDAGYWWVLSDGYAPAFTNLEYYSSAAGTYENTKEFAFQIRCACEDRLLPGDRLDIAIGGNLAGTVWGSSEKLEITVIPASPLYARGGLNADDSETWAVAGSDSGGPLPAAALSATVRHYSHGGLVFDLPAGGIPFTVGDRFKFEVEGGTFRWRRDAGTWSSPVAIADDAALERGLTVSFLPGPAPSFFDGDLYQFTALQEAAATVALAPGQTNWKWPSGAGIITLLSATAYDITALAITHELPAGATCTAEISVNGTTWAACPWFTGAFALRENMHLAGGEQLAIKGLRLTFSAPGDGVRWIWVGVPFNPQYNAALKLRHLYDMTRARTSGAGALLAEGTGASMAWEVLSLSDAAKLAAIVRAQKIAGDIPLLLVPHILHPEEAFLCKIDNDSFEITDEFNYEPNDTANRLLSASLELTPEWRQI